jgi:hypothetical protein
MSADLALNFSTVKSWRHDAVRIVEDLFRVTGAESWDLLLDLRASLQRGDDWNETLDIFLACRERLELGHYLPFYRLRTLLANSLSLEMGGDQSCIRPLRQILRRRHRSLAEIGRQMARELFEHGHDLPAVELQVVERI